MISFLNPLEKEIWMLRLTDFWINTSYLAKNWTVSGILYIVKVEIDDVAISNSLCLLEKIFCIYYI